MAASLHGRTLAFRSAAQAQPGCTPYDNHRPINVRKHSAGKTLETVLRRVAPYTEQPEKIQAHLDGGLITVDGKHPSLQQRLVAGNAIRLVIPDTIEPPIAPELTVLHEDQSLLVVDKPSPLPVHPCGRYNRNSLVSLARQAWPDIVLKPVHRLDANTTGVLAFAKTSEAARWLMEAFRAQRVHKQYLARVFGVPVQRTFSVRAPIEGAPSSGGRRRTSPDGQAAWTDVTLRQDLGDGTSLLLVAPRTGRTNQIRLHLQAAGFPIVGDSIYGPTEQRSHGITQDSGGLCLHAHRLAFTHPTSRQAVAFQSEAPAHFTAPCPGPGDISAHTRE